MDINWLAASGAPKADKRAFAAIGVLVDKPHSFMHDLESFFWVLCWVCHHWTGPGKETHEMTNTKRWVLEPAREVADLKRCLVDDESYFNWEVYISCTPYCEHLIPCLRELRKIVFPEGRRWATEDAGLYLRMAEVLEKARDDIRHVEQEIPRC